MTGRRAVAMALWLLAAVVFGLLFVGTALGGSWYPFVLGGSTPLGGPAALILGTASVIAAIIALALHRGTDKVVLPAFAAWLLLTALAAIVSSPYWLVSLGLSGVLAMAVAWPEIGGARQAR